MKHGFEVKLHLRSDLLDWDERSRRLNVRQHSLLQAVIAGRPIRTVAIGKNGMPVEMACVDPRNFAVMALLGGADRSQGRPRPGVRRWPAL